MDRRGELVVVAVLALVGAGLFAGFYGTFPSSTPPIEHDKADARATATAFLSEQGYDVSAFSHAVTYDSERDESVYIQRTLPQERVTDAMREHDVTHWTVQFYTDDPRQPESFAVAVDPTTGEVVGFTRTVGDGAPGERLSPPAARERAEAFLAARGHDLSGYDLVRNATTERANRTDHTFVWHDGAGGLGGAPHEIRVVVHGGQVGAYEAGLAVPEAFLHDYRVTQNYSLLPSVLFFVFSAGFGLVALYYGLVYYRQGAFDWRYALAAGGVVVVLSLVGAANSLPGIGAAVPSTLPPWLFYLAFGLAVLFGAGVQGTVTFLAAGTGKRLAADVLDRMPVGRLREARLDPDRRDAVLYGTVRGFLLAYALLGVYTVFYLVGTRLFGFWLPASDPNATAFTTAVPAVVALVVGGVAAVWEETAYRLFAVPLCKRHLNYTALALLVPAFVWGLGHAGYAVLPVWARVVETTLLGVILGYAFLRWDVLTTISAHFALNATVVAVPMLAAGGSLLVHGGLSLGVAMLPVLVGVGVYISGERSDETLTLTWGERLATRRAAAFADLGGAADDADGDAGEGADDEAGSGG